MSVTLSFQNTKKETWLTTRRKKNKKKKKKERKEREKKQKPLILVPCCHISRMCFRIKEMSWTLLTSKTRQSLQNAPAVSLHKTWASWSCWPPALACPRPPWMNWGHPPPPWGHLLRLSTLHRVTHITEDLGHATSGARSPPFIVSHSLLHITNSSPRLQESSRGDVSIPDLQGVMVGLPKNLAAGTTDLSSRSRLPPEQQSPHHPDLGLCRR